MDMRRRELMKNVKGDEDMSYWKLVKSGVVAEETNIISIDLDDEYEELNGLVVVNGTSSNNSVANLNVVFTVKSTEGETADGFFTGLMQKENIKRLLRFECKVKPYFDVSYRIISDSTINKVTAAQYMKQSEFFNRNFTNEIKSIKFYASGTTFFGVGTEYMIYGK